VTGSQAQRRNGESRCIDVVRLAGLVQAFEYSCASREERNRTRLVATHPMRHPYRQLRKRPPQGAFQLRRALPGGLQQLVRLEGTSGIEAFLGGGEQRLRVPSLKLSKTRIRLDAGGSVRERPA
jgi:hypothetical protein